MSKAPRRTPRETTPVASYTEDRYTACQFEAGPPQPPTKREPKRRVKRPLQPLVRNRPARREPPIRGMGSADIYSFLSERVREQSHALYRLAALLYQGLTCDRVPEGAHKPLLFRAMLAGTSGCGKTESILWIRYLLGMQPGFAYERQCVELDASTLVDESQMNSLIGAGAGLVGYGDGGSLPERLNSALYDFTNDDWAQLSLLERDSSERRKAEALYFQRRACMTEEARQEITPRYLLFFVDELDKACAQFYTLLNGLIETGHYRTNSGVEFRLPPQCRLFVLYTSNFGADEISRMTLRDYEAAARFVTDDMAAQGLGPHTIGRLDRCLCVYYPLKPETLRRLLMDKLDRYIGESPMAREYGQECICYTQEIKDFLVDSVLRHASPDRGVRAGLTKLFENLGTLFEGGLERLRALANEPCFTRPSLEHPVSLTLHSIDFQQIQLQQAVSPLLQQVLADQKNEDVLALCRERHQGVDAVTMVRKQILLSSLLLCINVNIQCDPQQLAEVSDEMDRLRAHGDKWQAEAHETRDTLGKIIDAIDAQDMDTARELASDRLDALASVQGAVPALEEAPRPAKRKKKAKVRVDEQTKRARHESEEPRVEEVFDEEAAVCEMEVECHTSHGRPARHIAGFERVGVGQGNHTKYQCNACSKVCDARYTPTHRCRQ